MSDLSLVKLPLRAQITISGDDRTKFIQGLITQDINLLDTQSLIYSCLLTPQGKFLFDFFIRQDNDKYIIDCEGNERGTSLLQRLSMYKLRSQVELELTNNIDVWQIFNGDYNGDYKDPRNDACGYRTYSKPDNLNESDFDIWDKYRIKHEVPDGSRDIIPEKSFIHEANLDKLNAVSFGKGCYVGQELISRMHHRGLAKKHLKCVDINDLPDRADLRSSCGNIGLAVVRN